MRDPLASPSKLRRWRRSLNTVARENLSVPNSLGGSLRSLDSLDLQSCCGRHLPRSSSAAGGFDVGGSRFSLNVGGDELEEDGRTICEDDEDGVTSLRSL